MINEQKLKTFYREMMSPVTDALVDMCTALATGVVNSMPNAKEEDLMKVIEPLIKTQRDLLLQQFKAIDIKQMVKDMGDKNGRRS